MENLPVLLLTDLICADERVTAEDVKRTHSLLEDIKNKNKNNEGH